jgi:16S rRNA (adenine1518-N6/adenine1519-N6)-dimethyltransferase
MRTSRRYRSQHFLVSSEVLALLEPEVQPRCQAVEVGAGKGFLTKWLVGICSHVIAIEIDPFLCEALRINLGDRCDIVCANVFDISLPATSLVVSSVPYSVSTRLLLKLFEEGESWQKSILILQREFVQKLTARPGSLNYRRISAIATSGWIIRVIGAVPRAWFRPPPKVDSVAVTLEWRVRKRAKELRKVVETTTILFNYRNRSLQAALRESGLAHKVSCLPPDAGEKLKRRVSSLESQDFWQIALEWIHE